MKKILSIIFLFLLMTACGKKQDYSEKDLVEIYARVELEPVEKSIAMIEKYHLDDEKKRDAYYNALREIATDREKWEQFLAQVDEFKIKKPLESK